MNVFACDASPAISASWLADQHVVKMTVESAQILSTALILAGSLIGDIYKPTHTKHPCTLAAIEDPDYFLWTTQHGLYLAEEYYIRFGKEHSSSRVLHKISQIVDINRPATPKYWPLAMPDEFKSDNPHTSYLNYLKTKYSNWRTKGFHPRWRRITGDNPFTGEKLAD